MALKELTSTGYVLEAPARLHSVVLTGTDETAVVKVEIRDGSGGTVLMTLQAQAQTSAVWRSGHARGVLFTTGIHATLSGTGPGAVAAFEYR